MSKDKCSRKKCGWIGTDEDKKRVQNRKLSTPGFTVNDLVCPKCGCKEFYEHRDNARVDKAMITMGSD